MQELDFYAYAPRLDAALGPRFEGPPVRVALPETAADAACLAGTALENGFANGVATVTLAGRPRRLAKITHAGTDYYADLAGADLAALGPVEDLGRRLVTAGFGRAAGLAEGIGRGALVATTAGEVRVERLTRAHRIETRDAGPRPLLWHGVLRVAARGPLQPVRLVPFGFGAWPTAPLLVAQRQRLAFDDWQGEVIFGTEHVTGEAGAQAGWGRAHLAEDLAEVEYHLLLLDRPAILFANGAPCESLSPADLDLAAADPATRQALSAALAGHDAYPPSPYPLVAGREVRAIVDKW